VAHGLDLVVVPGSSVHATDLQRGGSVDGSITSEW
jgi:hypothetical protein